MADSNFTEATSAKPKVVLKGLDIDPEFMRLHQIIGLYVNCGVAALGIGGNIISTIALRRSGLNKSSNILLWALAVSDAVFLCGMIAIPGRVYNGGEFRGWSGSRAWAFTNFVLWELHSECYLLGHFCSMTIPALITTERLLAVFFPFRFSSIVTPARTWAAVSVIVLLGLFFSLFMNFTEFEFYYGFFPEYNLTFGLRNPAPISEETKQVRQSVITAYSTLKGMAPVIYVTLGCIAIGIKLRLAAKRRQEMTKTTDSPKDNKTTLMLVLICAFFSVSNLYYSIPKLFPMTQFTWRLIIMDDLMLTMNSSVNFVIYVAVNKNLRGIIKSVVLCQRHNPVTKS